MKKFVLISTVFFLFSCASTYKVGSEGESYKIPKELSVFLSSFEQNVTSYNSDNVLLHMDKAYKKEQHDDMLEGRTEQFLNEFFSGLNTDGSGFVSVKFNSIKGIHFVSIQKNETGYTVYYTIETKEANIDCSWEISVKKTEYGTKYGLIGAVG